MVTAKERAIDLYMRGIRDGEPRPALDAHIGERYTQHSTGVKDGKEGFLEFFEPFLARHPHRYMKIHRALQDGDKVFVHCYQNLNRGAAEWVTMDFFDTDAEGKIIEHWDVIVPYSQTNPSGRSNIDGPTEIIERDCTDANKEVVRSFVEEVLIERELDQIERFIDPNQYRQHNPDLPDGLASFIARFSPDDCPLEYQELFMMVGEGNFVASMCRTTQLGAPYCQIDLFRLENGRIVEHWDAAEPVPPREEWANSGKF
ncbi:MAG: nuclear transport factor 2 family protein [Myxococcota bacterium]